MTYKDFVETIHSTCTSRLQDKGRVQGTDRSTLDGLRWINCKK